MSNSKYGDPFIPEGRNFENDIPQEDGITASTHFIPRRPQTRAKSSDGGKRPPRPHSIGATIISNPKLVKGWQYYDNESTPKNMPKYFSTIHLPPAATDFADSDSENDKDGDNFQNFDTATGEVKACVEKEKRPCQRYLGILLTLLASGALALSSIIVKGMPGYHPYSVSVWTFQGIFIPSLVILLFSCLVKKENVIKLRKGEDEYAGSNFGENFKTVSFIVLRAIFGWLGVVLKCYSLQFMSVADSTIIAFSSPVFVVFFAWIFLREKLGIVPIITAVVVLIGVGVITRPPLLTGEQSFDNDQLIGTAMAVSCMMLGVFTVIILRYIRHVHYALVTFVYGLVGTVGCLLLCWFIGEFQFPRSAAHWWLAGGIAALTFIGQSLITLALKYEQASTFALIRTSEIPFTFLWQFAFLQTFPDLLSLTGALLVIIGVFVISGRKWIEMQSINHRARRLCGFLLK